MKFEYYVLKYDFNKKQVVLFNIFRNTYIQEWTEKAVRKYLRSPKKFTYTSYSNQKTIYGFDAFVQKLDSIIKWQEWSRREYEISVGDAFETDCEKLEKWDCYSQAKPNMEMIAREVICQYKQYKKSIKDGE